MKKRVEVDTAHLKSVGLLKDAHIQVFKSVFAVRLQQRRGLLIVQGDDGDVEKCIKAIQSVLAGLERGRLLTEDGIRKACNFYKDEGGCHGEVEKSSVAATLSRHVTKGQQKYLEAIQKSVVTFVNGPAGTGKTYLAVGMAVAHLLAGRVDRLVLVRPAVEAGEKLGFLPGDLNEKIKPYLLPIFDSLRKFLDHARVEQYAERNIIEVAPLAYMRGRTLDNCFMIVDEAQNTTVEQMKMCLTRLGANSMAVVTGDLTQVDLARGERSGLEHAMGLLKGVNQISMVQLKAADIMRHPVVGAIVRAYDREVHSGG